MKQGEDRPDRAPTPALPDRAFARAMERQRDIEDRIGVVPLEDIQAEREMLVQLNSAALAMHGKNGIYKDVRDRMLAEAADRFRRAWTGDKAPSEALVSSSALLDPTYVRWQEQQLASLAAVTVVEDRITALTAIQFRGDALIKYVTSEPKGGEA